VKVSLSSLPAWTSELGAIVVTAAGSAGFAIAGDAIGSALLAALFGAAVWHAITRPYIELLQHALQIERELNDAATAGGDDAGSVSAIGGGAA
jgi:hypothetical protein